MRRERNGGVNRVLGKGVLVGGSIIVGWTLVLSKCE